MIWNRLKTALRLVKGREWRILYLEVFNNLYKKCYDLPFVLVRRARRDKKSLSDVQIQVETNHPVAVASPDHLMPFGTKHDNNTNRKFVLLMDALVNKAFPGEQKKFLDLGCAGGQLVKDFCDLGWISVGLEGSDYSLKKRRANWSVLANKNLFTADVTKPFTIFSNDGELKFHLITAWEVLEHIVPEDLDKVLANVVNSLVDGGFFIASTSLIPDVRAGVDFHQTKMTPKEWKEFIETRFSALCYVDLGLKGYQLVRYATEPYLTFRKR